MQRTSLFLSLVAVVTLIASCGGKDKSSGLAIPKDAAIVIHLNTPSLSSKLTWQEIKQTNWFKEMHDEATDSMAQQLLNDPAISGLNTEADMIFFMRKLAKGGGYMVFEGTLKDPAAFEAFNKKASKGATASKVGDVNVITADKSVIATWKDNRFIYVINAPFLDDNYSKRFQQSDLPDSTGAPVAPPTYGFSTDSLVKFAQELYTLKSDNNLDSDKKFAALLKETGDVHFWLNAAPLYSGMMTGALSLMKFSTLLEGNITTATVNFDNGKITAATKSYYNEELGKVYEKYRMKNMDADALKRIPSDNVVGVFSMNYPPDGLKEFLKLIGVDGFINGFLGKMDYSMDEFVKANKGDLLFAVSDFSIKTEEVTYPGYEGSEPYKYKKSEPTAKFLFATSINDKPAFDKLIGIAKAQLGELPQGAPKVTYSLNDKWFAIGNDEAQVNTFQAGSHSNKHAFISKISGHPAGGYIDISALLKASEASADSTSKAVFTESLKYWQDVVFTGGELKDGALIGSLEINMVDKNTNSLKQLNQYSDKLAALRKKGF